MSELENVKTLPYYKDARGRLICPTCLRSYRYTEEYNIYHVIQNLDYGQIHAFVELPKDKWKYYVNKIKCTAQYIKRRYRKRFKIMESSGELSVVVQRVQRGGYKTKKMNRASMRKIQ